MRVDLGLRSLVAVLALSALVVVEGCKSCESTKEGKRAQPEAGTTPKVEEAPAAAEVPEAEVDCFVIVDAEPDMGGPPLKVVFETDVDCTAEPVTYRWDFGDGTSGGNEANPTHVYEKDGDFVATVTATAPDGGAGSDEIDITVDEMLED